MQLIFFLSINKKKEVTTIERHLRVTRRYFTLFFKFYRLINFPFYEKKKKVRAEGQLSSKNYTLNYTLGSTQVYRITCIAEPRPFQRTVIGS